jgi:HlyD family secretion protein
MPDNIEIRSEEVQEILGQIPHWIIRWGLTVIFLVLLFLIIGSYFFKYPDIISTSITVTTQNPTASVIARTDGKFQYLFVSDKQTVKKDEMLGIIENPANFEHIRELENQLEINKFFFTLFSTDSIPIFSNYYSLGSVQTYYANFQKPLTDYRSLKKLNYLEKRIEAIEDQISKTQLYIQSVETQYNLSTKELRLIYKQYARDSSLFVQKVISEFDHEKSEGAFLQKKNEVEGKKQEFIGIKIQLSQLEQSKIDTKLQIKDQEIKLQSEIKSNYEILVNQIKTWKQIYLLISPIEGSVTFTNYWSINQNVRQGEVIFSVVPKVKNKVIGRVQLPIAGSGKVKYGQRVNIKFSGFPYMEYGMVRGKIQSISLVPAENFYLVEVNFPDSLKTNYGKQLPFSQEMKGSAEIITEDLRLIERFLNPIKTLVKNNR